jgi:hypothetical protein
MLSASAKWISEMSLNGGVAVRHFDVPPTFEGCEHHEEVGDAVAFIFIVVMGRTSWLHGDRRACLGHQLL